MLHVNINADIIEVLKRLEKELEAYKHFYKSVFAIDSKIPSAMQGMKI